MQIKLEKLFIDRFKGIISFTFEPNGGDVTIFGENGAGKTTIFDALLWLFFNKNSEGKADFDLRPLDADNKAIKGLVVLVEGTFSIDGVNHTFCREQHEKVVKGQVAGYETRCSIDEVPKKLGEYNDAIADIISEDIFKMLTDLRHFNTLHWSKQRAILKVFAEGIGTPKGFEDMLRDANGRDIKDYENVLKTRKKQYTDERDEINPRLDEKHKGLGEIGTADTKTAGTQRSAAITEKADLQERKTKLIEGETTRQKKVVALNILKVEQGTLEHTLRQGDPTKIGPLLREKLSWDDIIAAKRDELSTLRRSISDAETNLAGTENQLIQKTQRWSLVCDEYRELKASDIDATCPAGDNCPYAYMAKNTEATKAEKMDASATMATTLRDEKEVLISLRAKQKEHRDKLAAGVMEREAELAKLLEEKETGIAEIEKKIAACKEGINPEDDDEWKRLDAQIETAETNLGPSLAAGMGVVDKQIEDCQKNIDAANKVMANTDTIKASKDRIAELEAREKELAQLIADIEKLLADIGEYKAEESRMIEAAVNGKFKHVKFKLFETLLNGSIEDTCVAMLDGKPYPAMSSGEKIFVGIDIINVLSEHYSVSVVMFIDHLESLTLPIETESQVIGLFAEKGTKELTVKGS